MTVDPEVVPGEGVGAEPPAVPGARVPVSRTTAIWYSVVGAILFGWFLFGWLVLRQGVVDSAGESVGTAFALLVVVSIVGTLRRDRRR
jgi:hypothetical protein